MRLLLPVVQVQYLQRGGVQGTLLPTSHRSSAHSIRHPERLIARGVQPAEVPFPPTPPIRKGPSSRVTSSSKKPAGSLHSATPRSKPPSSIGVGPQRTEKEARGRFAVSVLPSPHGTRLTLVQLQPYKSYVRLSRKFKNVDRYTLWWPISSKERLLAPPAEIKNPKVNDLCINTIEDHRERQLWIFNEEHKWEDINVGDIRKIGDERRKLVVNLKGRPDWVLKVGGLVHQDVPVDDDDGSLTSAGSGGSSSGSNKSGAA